MFKIIQFTKYRNIIKFCVKCQSTEALNYNESKFKPDEVESIINASAMCMQITSNQILHFQSNQLGVNRPIEDRWNAGLVNVSNYRSETSGQNEAAVGHIFAVVDGHSGHACSHTVNHCHMDYVAAAMLGDCSVLERFVHHLEHNEFMSLTRSFVPCNTWDTMPTSIRDSHNVNIKKYINELLSTGIEIEDLCRKTAMLQSLLRLDDDMVHSALPRNDNVNRPLLRAVSSGAVGCFVYVPEDEPRIHVAQVGDCGAVLGCRPRSNGAEWEASLLMEPHNYQNEAEVERVQQAHPINETNSLILENRLLGELIPLRAFGNVRFKWPANQLKKTASLLGLSPSYPVTPRFYQTPPYLSCKPEVTTIELSEPSSTERFLILASDGLWDCLTPQEAVETVGQWLDSTAVHEARQTGQVCVGENVASMLIKRALGGPTMDHDKLATLLSLPGNKGRYYRDDITIVVIFFK